MESTGRNELWQKCRTLESQLQAANDKLVSCSRALRLSEKQISKLFCQALAMSLQQLVELVLLLLGDTECRLEFIYEQS
jgi:hypothetical protein